MTRTEIEPGRVNASGQRVAGPVRVGPALLYRIQCRHCAARHRATAAEFPTLACPYCQEAQPRPKVH